MGRHQQSESLELLLEPYEAAAAATELLVTVDDQHTSPVKRATLLEREG